MVGTCGKEPRVTLTHKKAQKIFFFFKWQTGEPCWCITSPLLMNLLWNCLPLAHARKIQLGHVEDPSSHLTKKLFAMPTTHAHVKVQVERPSIASWKKLWLQSSLTLVSMTRFWIVDTPEVFRTWKVLPYYFFWIPHEPSNPYFAWGTQCISINV